MHFLRFAVFLIAAGLLVPAARAQTPQAESSPIQHQPSQAVPTQESHSQRGDFDRGIYLGAAGNICGSIVSYNFSSGENPQLESITTCTPANRVTSKRARGRLPQPQNRRVFLMGVAEQSR
jgi:hypothetical protein